MIFKLVSRRKTKHNDFKRFYADGGSVLYWAHFNKGVCTYASTRINVDTEQEREYSIKADKLPADFTDFINSHL